MEELENYRKEIDTIDLKILELLDKRAKLAIKVGEIKKLLNLNVFQPQRESEVIDSLKIKSKVINPTSIEVIWKEIINFCSLLQKK